MMSKQKPVQSVERAISILKCFTSKKTELKLSEIASELGLNISTVHGIVMTLKQNGLLEQSEEYQKYRLGYSLIELGDRAAKSLDILRLSLPIIKPLGARIVETVHIATLDQLEVIYIQKEESTQSMRIYTTIGSRNPAHCTGVGKAMLAHLDAEVLESIIPEKMDRFTANTLTLKSELIKELATIRANGYAIDNEEITEGLTCVAAPIFDHLGRASYAISISGPTLRMTREKMREAIELIQPAAAELSHRLGFRG